MKSNRKTLRVGNITDETSPGELRRLFSKWGTALEVRIYSLPHEISALVVMTDYDAAQVVEWWHGRHWRGRLLTVKEFVPEE
jgi:hypothetical protein